MTSADILHFPSVGTLMRREQNASAVEQAPQRTAEQIDLLARAGLIYARAEAEARHLKRRARKLGQAGYANHAEDHAKLAKARLITGARDLAELFERTGLKEIEQLATTLATHAATGSSARAPRRRASAGSVVGFLRR